jgi:hypothetical protein
MQNPVEVPTAAEGGGGPEAPEPAVSTSQIATPPAVAVPELGGPTGPEPTRYGDWEKNGRCIDF